MDRPDSHPKRRGFLKRVGAFFGSTAMWRLGTGTTAVPNSSIAPFSGFSIPKYLPEAYQGYPQPKYLPPGYQLLEVYTDRSDGFGGGSDELALWFVNPKQPLAFNGPLSVYITRQPQKALATIENHTGIPVALSISR